MKAVRSKKDILTPGKCIVYACCLVMAMIIGVLISIYHYVEPVKDLGTWRFFSKQMSRSMILDGPSLRYLIVPLFLVIVLILSDIIFSAFVKKDSHNPIHYLLGAVLLIAGAVYVQRTITNYIRERNIASVRNGICGEQVIIHAGGFIRVEPDGPEYSYSNSMDALVNGYSAGNHYTELDFILSADDHLICSHHDDMEKEVWAVGLDATEPLTRDAFLNEKVYGAFQTMDIEMLADYMREHEDLYIITDIKSDVLSNTHGCAIIKDTCPDLIDRFIIQIYHEHEYEEVAALGFPYIIYTLYAATEKERAPEAVAAAAKNHELVGITFWSFWVDDWDYFSALLATDVPLFVHTVNNPEEMSLRLEQGVSAIYTDLTVFPHLDR
ncbi:MAG: hypothetical protein IJP92_18160 [Lachnospiraceae bacterium]|nr:hypothetical protein [Lachnospiraceae bacterium]